MNREIDLYDLFDAIAEDYFFFKTAFQRVRAEEEPDEERRQAYLRTLLEARQTLESTCALHGFDPARLIALHRLFFRWERVRGWSRIFPMQDHYDAIVSYLTAECPVVKGACA